MPNEQFKLTDEQFNEICGDMLRLVDIIVEHDKDLSTVNFLSYLVYATHSERLPQQARITIKAMLNGLFSLYFKDVDRRLLDKQIRVMTPKALRSTLDDNPFTEALLIAHKVLYK